MLKKLLFSGCVLCILLLSCKDEAPYQVKMKLSNLDSQTIYAVFEASDKKYVDTLFYDNTKELTIRQVQEGFQTLTIFLDNQTQWITVYLEPQKKITITGDVTDPFSIQIKGGKINDQLSDFKKKITPLLKEQADLLASEINNNPVNDKGGDVSRLANINHELRLEAESYIKQHPKEEASAILIRDFFSDPDDPIQMDRLLAELDSELSDFYVVKRLSIYNERAKQTMVGATIPAFDIQDLYGKSFSDKSFENRYFIIAFTALWCDMCHIEELLLDKIVAAHPKDSLGVLLISLDEHPEEVRKAIENDSIQWNIVTDVAGQAIEMFDLYNVGSLPKCFLIDKNGKIILKTENGNELKQTLDQLISNSDK